MNTCYEVVFLVSEREDFFLLLHSAKNKDDFIVIFLLNSNKLFIKYAHITVLFPLFVDAIAIIDILFFLFCIIVFCYQSILVRQA
jgi:hypothetical protein